MKKTIIFTIVATIMLIAAPVHAAMITGYVLIDGKQVPAEYTVLTGSTVSVGSGKNACIPHYTTGFLTIPGEITVDDHTYTVTEVGNVAFRLCNNLTGVDIKENVRRIGNFAFVGCEKISEITLPASLESLGSGAFINTVSNNPNSSVTCLGTTPPRWEYNDVFCFHELGISDPNPVVIPATISIYVPDDCEDTYRDANYTNADLGWTGPDGWGSFTTLHTGVQAVHIYRPADLMIVREIVNDGKYNYYNSIYLENDIDMTGIEWDWGIGNNEEHPFTGSFYGNGHTISNLKVQNENGPAGLFSYFGGHTVDNVTLKNCDIQGINAVGAFASRSGACNFTKVWAEDCTFSIFNGSAGGILGQCLTTGGANFNQCVIKDISINFSQTIVGLTLGYGGIIGNCFGTRINSCAVIGDFRTTDHIKPFIGICNDNDIAQVYNSYATDQRFAGYTPADNITYNDYVVLYGQTNTVTMPNGNTTQVTIDADYFKSLLMIPGLGLEHWVYQDGYYPLPVGFEDKIPVLVNQATYRPLSSTSTRVNGLMLASGTPWSTFLDMSENGYRSKNYFTYKLWIDDEFPYDQSTVPTEEPSPYLPISTATINSLCGVDYDRVLAVNQTGTKPYTVPTVIVDDEGKPVLDENGFVQPDGGSLTLYETPVYAPTAYSVYLPYSLNHNKTFRLYEPTNVITNGSTATIEMDEKDAEVINAWTPYYLVVNNVPVDLSTEEEITITPEPENNYFSFDSNYYMRGTLNPEQSVEGMYVMDEIDHFVQANERIPAWRTYFSVPNSITDLTVNREIRLYDDDYNYMTIEDYDGITVTATLRGRTFYKDNTWYTLTVPFDLSDDMGPLQDATICRFSSATLADDGTLLVNIERASSIEAGKPYLVKWSEGADIENPKFHNVTIKDVPNEAAISGGMLMIGFFSPMEVNSDSKVLYLGDNNRLYTPEGTMTINAFRAFFFFTGDEDVTQFSSIRLNVMPEVVTGVEELNTTRAADPNWYTIDGRVFKSRPTEPGIYINNGNKIIIK